MFDIGASELLLVIIVAIIVIGPKDMPRAMRTAGRWIGKVRRVSAHFRSGIDAMVREAEMEDLEKEWRARNAQIMKDHPEAGVEARRAEVESAAPPQMEPTRPPPAEPSPPASPDPAGKDG